jgi:hypothetical protein
VIVLKNYSSLFFLIVLYYSDLPAIPLSINHRDTRETMILPYGTKKTEEPAPTMIIKTTNNSFNRAFDHIANQISIATIKKSYGG